MKKIRLALFVFLCVCICNAPANFVYWTESSGSALTFDWTKGGSTGGLFGDPDVIGDTFAFFPKTFRVESQDGVSDQLGSQMQVELTAHAGQMITGIKITERGDYGILGTGEVSVSGTLFLTNLLQLGSDYLPLTAQDELVSNPLSPITSGMGSWEATAEISGLDWTKVKFQMDNNLMAITYGNSTAFIEKKITGGAVYVTIIPEPATLALLAAGGLALLRKRKV